MSFFDKLKQGASAAADKAQLAVDITKQTARLHSKKKQLETNFTRIGEEVYRAYQLKDLSQAESVVMRLSQENERIEAEIIEIEDLIQRLKQQTFNK